MEGPTMYHPAPRRPFDLLSGSTDERHQLKVASTGFDSATMSRSSSVMNLASSTLRGIYSVEEEEDLSPQARENEDSINILDMPEDLRKANTRPLSQSLQSFNARPRISAFRRTRTGFKNYYAPLIWQTCSLFAFGVAFGVLVTHLQRSQQIAPVPIPSITKSDWAYQFTWGLLGVAIGNALPRIDALMENDDEAVADGEYEIQRTVKLARSKSSASDMVEHEPSLTESGTGLVWQSAVRSIGAFVGIAFAVRRVPWQSTLQVSLTLAIANPVLWYLIDRSKSGFALSSVVGLVGTFLLLLVSPDFVPLPAIHQDQASERLGVFTWLASILFCTSLCFGAIGRKLRISHD